MVKEEGEEEGGGGWMQRSDGLKPKALQQNYITAVCLQKAAVSQKLPTKYSGIGFVVGSLVSIQL